MELEPGTKVKHKIFGEGSFVAYKNDNLIIEFDTAGKKVLSPTTFNTGILRLLNQNDCITIEKGTDMGEYIQFDTSRTIIERSNVAAVVSTDKKLIFNESYVLIGECLKCGDIYASYDLTIVGNLNADRVEIKGQLTVLGDIKVKEISCSKELICDGDIDADEIIAGMDVLADNIQCNELRCSGKVMVKNTIDVSKKLEVEKTAFTGEGIVGGGIFESKHTVVAEYFDFEGEVKGNVVELETNQLYGDSERTYSIEEIQALFDKIIKEKIDEAGRINEDNLLDCLHNLSGIDQYRLCDWEILTKKIVDISYSNSISNYRDMLYIIAAKNILPKEILNYETVIHVFSDVYPSNVGKIDTMEYKAMNVQELVDSLWIVENFPDELIIPKEEALEMIFQSIGIRYRTVKQFMEK